jgi:hypothetical protein
MNIDRYGQMGGSRGKKKDLRNVKVAIHENVMQLSKHKNKKRGKKPKRLEEHKKRVLSRKKKLRKKQT